MELQSAEINEVAAALCEAQFVLGPVAKDKKNPFFKSTYADLSSCFDALRGPLHDNGLSFVQATMPCESSSHMDIVTTIMHRSGQWVRGCYRTVLVGRGKDNKEKLDPQTIGSAITYAKRYAICAMIGLATSDDDGNRASSNHNNRQNQRGPRHVPEPKPKTVKKPLLNITPAQRTRLNAIYEMAGAKSDDGKRDMAAGYQLDLTKPANEIEKVLKRMEAEYKETS